MLVLSDTLDPAASRRALEKHRRVQLRSFLAQASADALVTRLEQIEHWDLALTGSKGPVKITDAEFAAMNPAERARLTENLRRQARSSFSFAYYRRDLVPAEDNDCPLPEFADWISSAGFISTLRELTGDESLNRADAHATVYRVGSFLKSHDDTYTGKNRRFAYVLNLTRRWQGDWGGLLHFEDAQGNITGCYLPRYNSLSLFAVPQSHFVSQVATYALNPRYAITGWLFAD